MAQIGESRLLIDTDAFLRLSGCGILGDTIEILGYEMNQARRLSALPFMLKGPSKSLKKYPPDIIQRALEDCERVAALETLPSDEIVSLISEAQADVQEGEALLYAVAAENNFCLLVSNDKRAMLDIASHHLLKTVREAVRGRVVCMEVLVRHFMESFGVTAACAKLRAMESFDARIRTIISPAFTGRPEDCIPAADSYIADLKGKFGNDFLYDPNV